ncbi:phosphate/phosphite/phosphonate ABC transporter substrate-binding protein [Candidatus Electronema sp. PJ]|uniref:phosphate/phosphite/phosphonate ABC transporter substrate-binding protein n=1 Tax=Candidatus Electronema sp. PJ TaxID=3401572 RepID=UPI003AA9C68D
MKGRFLFIAGVFWLAFAASCQAAEDKFAKITLGFLTWNGPFKGQQQWEATGEYLAKKLERPVEVLPLEFKEVLPAVEAGKVDFFTADPSMFAAAKVNYGAVAVATMKNAVTGTDLIGGVIFTTANNKSINGLTNLKGKKFGAVRRWSFAGWQMTEKEFQDAGIDAYTFVSTLRFFETPQAVIKAVLAKQVDAGTVPTGFLEQAEANGEIKMDDVKILEKKHHRDFPYLCSTVLYPGFPLAKTASVDKKLAAQVTAALKALTPEDQALKDSGLLGWINPLDYSGIEIVRTQLRGGGYASNK